MFTNINTYKEIIDDKESCMVVVVVMMMVVKMMNCLCSIPVTDNVLIAHNIQVPK